jgi:hypothetical protein
MTNPLIAKYEELYGKKEEPKAELVKLSQEQSDILNKYLQNTNFPYAPPQSVATSNTGITAVNPSRTFTSYEPTEDAFLEVAGKVQKGDAKVVSMHMNMEHFRKSYTFEVQVYT